MAGRDPDGRQPRVFLGQRVVVDLVGPRLIDRDAIHENAVARHVDRQALGEGFDAVLEGGVNRIRGVGADALDRGEVDDAAPSALGHPGQEGMRDAEDVLQVDLVERLPLYVGQDAR